MESGFVNVEDQNYFQFETEYTKYLTEQFAELWDNVLKVQELLSVIDNSHLVKAVKKLSEREQNVFVCQDIQSE